jgi:hypothetical protein
MDLRRMDERERLGALAHRTRPAAALDDHERLVPRLGPDRAAWTPSSNASWRVPAVCASGSSTNSPASRHRAGPTTPRRHRLPLHLGPPAGSPDPAVTCSTTRSGWPPGPSTRTGRCGSCASSTSLPGKRAAFVMKVHHAIADGLGMVQLLSHMVDLEADPGRRPTTGDEPHAVHPARPSPPRRGAGVGDPRRPVARPPHRPRGEAPARGSAGRRCGPPAELLRDPRGTIEQLGRTTGSIARVVKPATTPLSPLMTDRSLNTHFDAVSVPVRRLKAAADRSTARSTTRSWRSRSTR